MNAMPMDIQNIDLWGGFFTYSRTTLYVYFEVRKRTFKSA